MYSRAYYAANAEEIKAKVRARHTADPAKKNMSARINHLLNLERDHARSRAYHQKHRERRLQQMRERYLRSKGEQCQRHA